MKNKNIKWTILSFKMQKRTKPTIKKRNCLQWAVAAPCNGAKGRGHGRPARSVFIMGKWLIRSILQWKTERRATLWQRPLQGIKICQLATQIFALWPPPLSSRKSDGIDSRRTASRITKGMIKPYM